MSHSVKDTKIVGEIQREFNEKDVDLYIAEQDIQPGSYLVDKVKSAIKKCDLFVVLITKDGSRSTFVQSEIGIAMASSKRIVPLLEEGVVIPSQLSGIEYITFNSEEPENALDSLKTFLSRFKLSKEHKESIQLSDTIFFFALVILGIVLIAAFLSRK